jgi:hypothetical protein
MRGNPHVPFGKGPTEKDPSHGHLAGGLLHLPAVEVSTRRNVRVQLETATGSGGSHGPVVNSW